MNDRYTWADVMGIIGLLRRERDEQVRLALLDDLVVAIRAVRQHEERGGADTSPRHSHLVSVMEPGEEDPSAW